jgi:hypothetical protein
MLSLERVVDRIKSNKLQLGRHKTSGSSSSDEKTLKLQKYVDKVKAELIEALKEQGTIVSEEQFEVDQATLKVHQLLVSSTAAVILCSLVAAGVLRAACWAAQCSRLPVDEALLGCVGHVNGDLSMVTCQG